MGSALILFAAKTFLIVFGCCTAAGVVYLLYSHTFSTCTDLHHRWLKAALADFSIFVGVFTAWFVYKESSWIKRVIFMTIVYLLGGPPLCAYLLMLLFKLSPEESSKDPFYFVLVRHAKSDATQHTWRLSVVTMRVIFSIASCLMLSVLCYTIIIEGSPLHAEIYRECMIEIVLDHFVLVVIISVWIAYKESSWMTAFLWILSLFCFGSTVMCVYVLWQLFKLSPDQRVSIILFNENSRDLIVSDQLLKGNANA